MAELFGAALGFYVMALLANWILEKLTRMPEPKRVAIASVFVIIFSTIAGTYGNAHMYGTEFHSFVRSYLVYAQGGFWFLLITFIGKVKD